MTDVNELDPNPFQARTEYPETHLRDIGGSVKNDGVIQPIVVRRKGDRFEVCVGWMRVLAARLVRIPNIPAIVRDLTDKQMAKYNLVENLRRKDLNIVEKARGYKTMQQVWHLTQEQVADVLGESRDQVAQAVRVLTFPRQLQELVSHDTITQTHAEALARLADSPAFLEAATAEVLHNGFSASQTELLVQHLLKRRQLRKDIIQYVTSEDFILALDYLVPDPPERKVCPLCFAPDLQYDEQERLACNRCGWNDAPADKLQELIGRIRDYRLEERGIK